ncbi:HigA family addiction module antitoxin [Parahaliea maris]|uniref:HigA family addiction module antitoxin n=1 Tax=Parahaliea maris TaxID=2716870 RepID=UPI00164EFB3C|nr:HigA family addiction module antitoxin [Parahaliea maris]
MSKTVSHPGTLLESLILEPGGCSQSQLARQLGFNQPQPVNELIKGKRNITPKMALLLERVTDGAYPVEFWLLAQMQWDVAQARESVSPSRVALVQALELGAATSKDDAVRSLLELAQQLEPAH